MKIRRLQTEEMTQVVELSEYVFNTWLAQRIPQEEVRDFFHSYMNAEELSRQVENGELFVWGQFSPGRKSSQPVLTGVCAMTSQGLITMLYIHPYCQNDKLGQQFLMTMRSFASAELQLNHVYVNAVPIDTAGYFRRFGFYEAGRGQQGNMPYIALAANTVYAKQYEHKEIPFRVMISLIAGFSAAVLVSGISWVLLV